MSELSNRVSIVTGGARGIGYGMSHRLAEPGSTVVIVDLDPEATERAAATLRDEGFDAAGVTADIGKTGDVESIVDRVVGQYGRADKLANIAGTWSTVPFDEIGVTLVIALEGGAHGITANAIAPGLIVTEGVRQNEDLDAVSRQVLPIQSVQRPGEPADVAAAVAFFVSPRAGFVSGQTLFVDGGQVFN